MFSGFTASHRGGAGPPLVCLHGFMDTWRTWELVLPALERHHDVLALTLPGHAGGPEIGGPITTTAVIVAAGVIGFYSVATLADYRHFGYAEATMRKIYDQVKQESGIEHTVLQATRSGYGLYERMGYRRITNFSVYVTN